MPFVKGQRANPNGRPVGSTSFRTQLQEAFVAHMKKSVKDAVGNETAFFNVFNETFMSSALDPKSQAFKFLAERLYAEDILKDVDAQVNRQRREDADFAAYRIHRMAFDIQQRVLASKAPDIGLMAGRRAGKTGVNSLKASDVALTSGHRRVLIIGLTITKTEGLYREDIKTVFDALGCEAEYKVTDACYSLPNGSLIQFGGNANKAEREKYRGQDWDLVVIDECQSQQQLQYLVEDIIEPMLIATKGQLILSGTGPRTRGTYWEHFYNNPRPMGLRLNWDLTSNPNIPDHETAIEEYCTQRGLAPDDPMVLRELRGLIVYDDEALVYRLSDKNFFTWEEFDFWLKGQSPDDIRFVAGLDFGKEDSDALVVVCYSEKRDEKFCVWEYKKNGTGFVELQEAIKAAKFFIENDPRFSYAYRKKFDIYADTNESKFILDANVHYGLNILPAIKHEKAMGIQMMQDEIRSARFRVIKDGILHGEMLRTIFKRLELEGQPSIVTREIDDETYHPDALDAMLYAMRNWFLTHGTKNWAPSSPPLNAPTVTPQEPTQDWKDLQKIKERQRPADDQLS